MYKLILISGKEIEFDLGEYYIGCRTKYGMLEEMEKLDEFTIKDIYDEIHLVQSKQIKYLKVVKSKRLYKDNKPRECAGYVIWMETGSTRNSIVCICDSLEYTQRKIKKLNEENYPTRYYYEEELLIKDTFIKGRKIL